MKELRLRGLHELTGAVFRSEAGWQVPSSYGPSSSEVLAVRTTAGLIDLSDRAKVTVRGSDRTSFLDGLVTVDVKALGPGMSTYGLVLTDRSRVVGDLRIYAFEDRYVLDVDAGQAGPLLAYIQKFLVSDDVILEDFGATMHIEVHGPDAGPILSSVVSADVRGLPPDRYVSLRVERRLEGIASRVDGVGEPGYAVWAAGDALTALWSRLVDRGVTPIGRDAFEALRIEAGRPRIGAEMGEATLALEVAPAGAISFSKGCYVGQEIVARGTYQGHMNRRLYGLQVDGDVPPVRGDVVRTDIKEVGAVTSGAWSPTLGRVIALALLRTENVSADAELSIDRGGWDLRAGVHSLPFVRGHA